VSYAGTVHGSDPDSGDVLSQWQIKGGDGVGIFHIDSTTGDITIPDTSKVDTSRTTPYTLTVFVGDGKLPSHDATITINPVVVVSGTVQLIASATLTKLGSGDYQAVVKVSNLGKGTAQNVRLTSATLGSAAGSPVPQSLINIPPGGYATTTVTFPASAGSSGAMVAERYSGTYQGGTFAGSIRAVLP
jgi:hypothetical protein